MIKKKTKLKMLRNILFFITLIFVTFTLIFKDQDMNLLFKTINNSNKIYLMIGALFMLGYFLTEAYNLRRLLFIFGERKIPILKALKFTLIGFFFSSVTPAATGGQPIEIYYMTKEKISAPKAALACLVILCGFQVSTISIGIISAILNPELLNGGLIWLYLLGIGINCIGMSILFICVFSKKLTMKLMNIVIRLMRLFKVKNFEKKKEAFVNALCKYNESSVYIKSHMWEFIKSILRGFLQISLYYSVPFFIYKSLGLSGENLFHLFAMQAILYATVSGLPLPGAVGISETVFIEIFKRAFGISLISASMLLSRGTTFYLYLIISLFVVTINFLKMRYVSGEIDKDVVKLEEELNESTK